MKNRIFSSLLLGFLLFQSCPINATISNATKIKFALGSALSIANIAAIVDLQKDFQENKSGIGRAQGMKAAFTLLGMTGSIIFLGIPALLLLGSAIENLNQVN